MSDQQYDTEITLGVGKLLGLFFLLVILCGVFMGLGYMLGRNSAKQENVLAADAVPAGTISTAAKPGATQATPAPKPVTTQTQAQTAVDTGASPSDPVGTKSDAAPSTPPQAAGTQPPEMKSLPGGGYVVQIAAVSKKEDADALTQALRNKQYPVVVTPGAADKLYHVQIGPYAELKDAESMKSKLAADGYNAIVKR